MVCHLALIGDVRNSQTVNYVELAPVTGFGFSCVEPSGSVIS
jgi:hypothetical protein